MSHGKAAEEVPHVRGQEGLEEDRGLQGRLQARPPPCSPTPGLAAGAAGRRREAWACRECGFGHTYRM